VRVLITRPQEAARETAERVAALGHEPLIAPMLETVFPGYAFSGLERAQALLVTSANAVAALERIEGARRLPVYAVGARTAEAARAAGLDVAGNAEGDARDLAELLKGRLDPRAGPLAFARGRHVAGGLTAQLADAGFALHTAVVYETHVLETLDPSVRTRLESGEVDAVLFFSPRTARAFARVVEKEGLAGHTETLAALCLSQKIADSLAPLAWGALRVAAAPNLDALLALIADEPR
jgi:uroporphyrinogen-III synthase